MKKSRMVGARNKYLKNSGCRTSWQGIAWKTMAQMEVNIKIDIKNNRCEDVNWIALVQVMA
jgi:hypothetical protein